MNSPPPPPRLHPRPHLRLVSPSRDAGMDERGQDAHEREPNAGRQDSTRGDHPANADQHRRDPGDRRHDAGSDGPSRGRRDTPAIATPAPRRVPAPPGEAWHVIDAHEPDGEDGADDDAAPARAPQPRLLVALLIGLQAMAALAYGAKYAELARAGGVYGLATALALPAAIALYAGAVLLLARPGRGRALFFTAAVGLGLSIPAWGVDASWTWPVAAGAMLALAGAWVARAEVHVPEDAEAQP